MSTCFRKGIPWDGTTDKSVSRVCPVCCVLRCWDRLMLFCSVELPTLVRPLLTLWPADFSESFGSWRQESRLGQSFQQGCPWSETPNREDRAWKWMVRGENRLEGWCYRSQQEGKLTIGKRKGMWCFRLKIHMEKTRQSWNESRIDWRRALMASEAWMLSFNLSVLRNIINRMKTFALEVVSDCTFQPIR